MLAPFPRSVLAVVPLLAGCAKPLKQEDGTAINLRKIVEAYDIAEYKMHRAPRDEAELRKYVPETGVPDPDAVFVSQRDREPFVVHYGAPLDPINGMGVVLAHEKTGVNGSRYVITLSRDIRQVSDAEFPRIVVAKPPAAPTKGKKTDPGS